MTFKKGDIKPSASGRKKGSENKATKDIKEAYKLLIEANLDNMTQWIERIAATDPDKAIRILSELSEYVVPKLSRTEVKNSGEITIKSEIDTLLTKQVDALKDFNERNR